jgi:DNA repair exonuclease SbcCD ATPase subunit
VRVSRIQIDNILGIEHMEIQPGNVTAITGGNGTGKTSVLEAVKAAIGGGHDATLLRNGADSGRVVLVLEDQTEITTRITEDKTERSVKHPVHGRIGQAATYLRRLADALSVNPVSFLTAAPKDRARYLLEALPLEVTDEMLTSCGLTSLPPGAGLQRLDLAQKAVYDQRTGVGRSRTDAEATVRRLSSSMPEASGRDWTAVATEAEFSRRALEQEEAAELGTMLERAAEYIRGIEQDYADRIRALERERDAKVEEARQFRETRRIEIKGSRATRIKELEQTATEARMRAREDARAAGLRDELEGARRDVRDDDWQHLPHDQPSPSDDPLLPGLNHNYCFLFIINLL